MNTNYKNGIYLNGPTINGCTITRDNLMQVDGLVIINNTIIKIPLIVRTACVPELVNN